MSGDLLGVDLEPFEDRLVEEAPLALVSRAVGGLEVLGQRQGDVDGGHRIVVRHLEVLDQLLGGQAFSLDALHLGVEELLADAVGQVRFPELAFLAPQPSAIDAGAAHLLPGDSGQPFDMDSDGGADQVASGRRHLDRGVVALDGRFDGLDAVVGLRAGVLLAAAADEVVVVAAVALNAREEESAAAFGAEDAAPQVVVVAPRALAALALGLQNLLDLQERDLVDERLVAAGNRLAGVGHEAGVVRAVQDRRPAVDAERLGRCLASRARPQPACLK